MDFKPFRLGDYLLLERLATGGMAEVYRGKLRGAGGFEKQLAIKRILPHYSSNEEFVRMFEFEARLSSQLTHANIVQIYNFQKISGAYLLTMEFVNGKNLRQFVNKVKKINYTVSIACAVYIINEVCKGLDYAHSRKDETEGKPLNIIHRDMSPQNVMLSYEGAVKIVDFGIAKARDRADETRSGVIKGKFGYMSPEQANGESIDSRTDIFSNGIMLYELTTGKRLFQTDNDIATLKLIQECMIAVPTKINPKIPLDLEKIILRTLTKDRNTRFQTAGQMHRALQEFLNKHFPSFTQKDLADILHSVFVSEMEMEQKRSEDINRQSIPFSQGEVSTRREDSSLSVHSRTENEPVTNFDKEEETGFTFGEDSGLSDLLKEIEDQSKSNQPVRSISRSAAKEVSIQSPTEVGTSTEAKTSVRNEEKEVATELKTIVSRPEDSVSSPSHSNPEMKGEVTKIEEIQESSATPAVSINREPYTHTPTLPNMGLAKDIGASRKSISYPNRSVTEQPIEIETQSKVESSQTSPHKIEPNSQNIEKSITQDQKLSKDTQGNFRLPKSEPLIELAGAKKRIHDAHRMEEVAEPKKHHSVSWVTLVLVAVITYAGVELIQRGLQKEPQKMVVETILPERPVAAVPKPKVLPPNPTPAAVPIAGDLCTLKAETDPPGAVWSVNGQNKGVVGVALVACNEWVEVVIKKAGYETLSNRIKAQKQMKPYRFTLKAAAEGILEFKLNYRARLFVDGSEIQTYDADKFYTLSLPAAQDVKLRFLNETLTIDTETVVRVKKGQMEHRQFKIDELPRYQ